MDLPLIDITLIVFVAISVLIGIYRGFVKEILSVAAWVLAALVAYRYGEAASQYIKPYINQEPLDLAIAYVAVFLIALIAFSVISHIISQIFSSSGMSGFDRILGGVFGILRAAIIIGVLIIVGRYMAMDQQQWWIDSGYMSHFEPLVEWLQGFIPEQYAKEIQS